MNPNVVDVTVMCAGCVTRRAWQVGREAFVGCPLESLAIYADSDASRLACLGVIKDPAWEKLAG